mmetsp:Transcript_2447/g.5173  ORF Transcript_2447/g.5173 Transcript_2447/m.5173 type:complete len:373 (+) Transcript_2447:133-1251(+)
MVPKAIINRANSLRVEVDTNNINDCDNINMLDEKDCLLISGAICQPLANIQYIEERLSNVIENAAMSPNFITRNRSPDLVPLVLDYEQLKKRLRTLIGVLKTYQKCTRDAQKARFEIAGQLALLSDKSPIQDEVGCELDSETTEKLEQLSQSLPPSPSASPSSSSSPSSPTTSFVQIEKALNEFESFSFSVAEVVQDYRKRRGAHIISLFGLYRFGAADGIVNDVQYQTQIVNYVTRWKEIVTDRVDSGLKRVRKLASDRLHYERKVETLRNRANNIESKGKENSVSAIERLSRNEDKLKISFAAHEKEASKICALVESVTQEGYKELFTLIRSFIEWETNRIGRENDIVSQLNATLLSMSEKVKNTTFETK